MSRGADRVVCFVLLILCSSVVTNSIAKYYNIPRQHLRTATHTAVRAHKPTVHWKHTRAVVTEYVVRRSPANTCWVYTARTASGTRVQRGSIAVDTRVFPFGTKFLIPHYGYGVARDTGGAVIGHHLDAAVYSCHEAFEWGRRTETVLYTE